MPLQCSFFYLPFRCSRLTQSSDGSLKLWIDDFEAMLCGKFGTDGFVLLIAGNGDAPPLLLAELEGSENAFLVAPVLDLDAPAAIDEGDVSGH